MICIRSAEGGCDLRMFGESPVVIICNGNSRFYIGVEEFKLHIQHCRLHRVEAAITSYQVVIISLALSVISDHSELFRKLIIVGEHGATVAVAAKIFRRE